MREVIETGSTSSRNRRVRATPHGPHAPCASIVTRLSEGISVEGREQDVPHGLLAVASGSGDKMTKQQACGIKDAYCAISVMLLSTVRRHFRVMKPQIVIAGLLLSVPVLGGTPMAPPQICIDSHCTSSPVRTLAVTKKWHPGHYLKTQGAATTGDQASYVRGVLQTLPKVLEDENLKGAYVDFAWGAINPTGSSYDWVNLDAVLNWLCSRNKMLILSVSYKKFGDTVTPERIMPADLVANGEFAKTESGVIAAVWRANVMNRLIDAMNAIAERYDNNQCLELVTSSESAPSFGNASWPADYSVSALSTQLVRMYEAQSNVFKETNVAAQVNFLGNQAATLIEKANLVNVGRAGPDSIDDTGSRIFVGEQVKGAGTTARDYRGVVPHHVVASAPALGGRDNNGPPSNIIKWAQRSGVTHLSWVSTVSASPNTWLEIKSAIDANPRLSVACPRVYAGCISN
jgi:hypothetical protein